MIQTPLKKNSFSYTCTLLKKPYLPPEKTEYLHIFFIKFTQTNRPNVIVSSMYTYHLYSHFTLDTQTIKVEFYITWLWANLPKCILIFCYNPVLNYHPFASGYVVTAC